MAYCERADVEAVYGIANVKTWADLDSDGDAEAITARIDAAIAEATEEIDDRLRYGPYALPLANDSDEVPLSVKRMCATLAGVLLYEARGVQDYNPDTGTPVNKLLWNRRRVETFLSEVRARKRTLSAVESVPRRGPQVAEDDE